MLNNISVSYHRLKCLQAGFKVTLTPFDTNCIRKEKCNKLQSTYIHNNIFSLKSAEKQEYPASPEKQYSLKKMANFSPFRPFSPVNL